MINGKKKQDEIEQLKQDAKVDKNAAWKVADGRLKHKQDNLNMAFDDRKKHQQDWIDNGKKGVKQGLKNGEFKYHGKKHKWPSNNPVPFQRSDDEKEVLAKFDKEPFFNNETNESKNSMKKNVVKINENTLRQIVAESVKRTLNEIGDTRAGQYMLGKLWGKKYDEKYEESPGEAYKYAEPIRKYAQQNNRKSVDGLSAFDTGTNAQWNSKLRQQELNRKGKTKRRSEEEIFNALLDKDKSEKVMDAQDIQSYAYDWMIKNYGRIIKYKGDKLAQNILQREGCRNLGELIIKMYDKSMVPGWVLYKKFFNEIYDELNLYHDGGSYVDRNNGFGPAWEQFCGYVYEHS